MRELSLFTGAGGGLLGTKLLGWEPIGYVEWNQYCQKIIRQRIIDGFLPNAPIFGDIRAFISEGYAASYTGLVDVITGGFPCQPFSNAGKRLGADDHRNMFPETAECIRVIRPKYAYLENVAAITSNEYFGTILATLSSMGYRYRWGTLGGGAINNAVNGERVWILATSSDCAMLEGVDVQKHFFAYSEESRRRQYSGAVGAMLSQDDYAEIKRNPDVVSRGMDRLKAIGNAQIPIVAATAWRILSGNII